MGIRERFPTPKEVRETAMRLEAGQIDLDSVAFSSTMDNVVTIGKDMVRLLERFHRQDTLGSRRCQRALDIMGRQQLRDRIPGKLPKTTMTYTKTGTIAKCKRCWAVLPRKRQPVCACDIHETGRASRSEGFACSHISGCPRLLHQTRRGIVTMRAGVIGPHDIVAACVETGREYPEVEFIPLPYSLETEALDIFEKHKPAMDLFLFAGSWPYYQVLHLYGTRPMGVPVVTISPENGSTIYKNLARVMAAGKDPRCISLDTVPAEHVKHAYSQLGIPYDGVVYMELTSPIPRDTLIDFHLSHWKRRSTCCALTYIKSVYETLKQEGVPVFRGTPQ